MNQAEKSLSLPQLALMFFSPANKLTFRFMAVFMAYYSVLDSAQKNEKTIDYARYIGIITGLWRSHEQKAELRPHPLPVCQSHALGRF